MFSHLEHSEHFKPCYYVQYYICIGKKPLLVPSVLHRDQLHPELIKGRLGFEAKYSYGWNFTSLPVGPEADVFFHSICVPKKNRNYFFGGALIRRFTVVRGQFRALANESSLV